MEFDYESYKCLYLEAVLGQIQSVFFLDKFWFPPVWIKSKTIVVLGNPKTVKLYMLFPCAFIMVVW